MFKFGHFEIVDRLAVFCSTLFIIAGSIVSVLRYWQYEIFYYDFGIFDTAIWKVAHFQKPIIDHFIVGGKINFADHFNPSIFLLSPIYWFTDKQEVLLIVQSLAVGLSGLVIYFIAKEVFKKVKPSIDVYWASLAVLISYYLFIGIQNAVISDFHEVTVATLPFALSFYFLIKKNIKLFLLFGLITLGFKETLFLLGFAIGIFVILFDRKLLKLGVAVCLFSLLYGIFTIKFLIPYFSGGIYIYGENVNFETTRFITSYFDTPLKLDTIFKSLWSFSFLPVFSPVHWILILEDFGVRFYSTIGESRTNLGLHYSAMLSVILAVSSVYGLKFISPRLKELQFKLLLMFIILNSLFIYRFVLHGPLALSYNPDFYAHTKDFVFLDNLIKKVPKGATVMTQNNLAPHFLHSQGEVYLLKTWYRQTMPDYVVFDLRPGQNPNDFFDVGEKGAAYVESLLRQDECYKLEYDNKYQIIYKKTSDSCKI